MPKVFYRHSCLVPALLSLTVLLALNLNLTAQTAMPGTVPLSQKRSRPVTEQTSKDAVPISRRYQQIKPESVAAHILPPLSERDRQKLEASDNRKKVRIGTIRNFASPLDGLADSTEFTVPEGRVAIVRIVTTGSLFVRVQFTDVTLPTGARLFVYAPGQADVFSISAQDVDNKEFWTPPIKGDQAVIEYFVPKDLPSAAQRQSPFHISAVSHIYKDLTSRSKVEAASCHLDIPPAWSEAARSVGLLQITNRKGEFACTGTLLNSAAKTPGSNYLLTANHCVSTPEEAGSVFAYWLFDSGTEPPPTNFTNRAELMATGLNGDFTLLRYAGGLPDGVRLSGWSITIPNTETAVTGIHHPLGERKRISFGKASASICTDPVPGGFCDSYLKVLWTSGVTEPGSSGSGIWMGSASDPLLVGTLSGGSSSCENRAGADYYGRLDTMFPAFSYYLTKTGCVFKLSETTQFVGDAGGNRSATISQMQGENCGYNTTSAVPWITVTSGASGTNPYSTRGGAHVSYTIAANPDFAPRLGILTIGGQQLAIYQAGKPRTCAVTTLTPGQTITGTLATADCASIFDAEAYADRFAFTGTAGQQIAIELNSTTFDATLTLLSPAGEILQWDDDSGQQTNARVPNKTNSMRFVTLPETGQYLIEASTYGQEETGSYQLALLSGTCSFAVTPRSAVIGSDGGDLDFTVTTTGSNCQWVASSNLSWVSAPVGFGVRNFRVGPNDQKVLRTGIAYIAGLPITITQEVPCTYSLTQDLSTVPAQGGRVNVEVKRVTGNLCDYWYFDSSDGLVLSYNRTSTGGSVLYRVDPNRNLAPRTLRREIAGQFSTITQAGADTSCGTLPIAYGQPVTGTLSASDCRGVAEIEAIYAKRYTFAGTAGQRIAIALNAREFESHLYLFDPAGILIADDSQYGGGINDARIDATLAATGTYTIEVASNYSYEGGAFSLGLYRVDAGCYLWLKQAGQNLAAAGGQGQGEVNTDASTSCPWTAVSQDSWIKIEGTGSGTGRGSFQFSVTPNPGWGRTGIISVAGWHFTVMQDGTGLATVSAASYVRPQDALAPDSIVSVFGTGLATRSLGASQIPLPLNLWTTQVKIKDSAGVERAAPLFYVSPLQVNFLVPPDTAPGEATISTLVTNGNYEFIGYTSTGKFNVAAVAPGLFSMTSDGKGVASALVQRIKGSTQSYEPVFEKDLTGKYVAKPIDVGVEGEAVYLLLFGTGIRNRSDLKNVTVSIGGLPLATDYAGAQGFYVGVDQINVLLPKSLRGKGLTTVQMTVDGKTSNTVEIKIAP